MVNQNKAVFFKKKDYPWPLPQNGACSHIINQSIHQVRCSIQVHNQVEKKCKLPQSFFLKKKCFVFNLFDESDTLHQKLSVTGVFSVKSMYMDLINTDLIPKSLDIWKTKVTLKINVFMWFFHKEVILTKDNLTKCCWEGSKRCCFYNQDKSIQHLFIECPLAKLLQCAVHVAFNISPPNSIATLFRTWLNGVEPKTAAHIQVGMCALLWAI